MVFVRGNVVAFQREALGTLDLLVHRLHLHLEVTKIISTAFASLLAAAAGGYGEGARGGAV